MSQLFNRVCAVTINTTKSTKLDVAFKIEKSLKSEPNKCELHVFNLKEDQRAAIEELVPQSRVTRSRVDNSREIASIKTQIRGLQENAVVAKQKNDQAGFAALEAEVNQLSARATMLSRSQGTVIETRSKQLVRGIPVKIEAGYDPDDDGGDLSLLWLGDMRTAHSVKSGPDWTTILTSGDGEKAWQNARINVSYGPKTPVATALRAMVKELGIGEGNLATVLGKLQINGIGYLYPQGTVISGPVSRELTDFCRSADLEWSIQDGVIQILDKGKALGETAIKVSSDTGMLDSPTVDVDGILKVKMLMIPGIRPGRLLVVDAERVKGNYRAEKITWQGDTSAGAQDWTVEIQAVRY